MIKIYRNDGYMTDYWDMFLSRKDVSIVMYLLRYCAERNDSVFKYIKAEFNERLEDLLKIAIDEYDTKKAHYKQEFVIMVRKSKGQNIIRTNKSDEVMPCMVKVMDRADIGWYMDRQEPEDRCTFDELCR